jgi:anti-anti-sigma factor
MAACRLDLVSRDDRVLVVLVGELDVAARPLIDEAARRCERPSDVGFALDLGGISFVDVAGLEVVVGIARACGVDPPIHLLAASPSVQRLIGILGVEHAFRIEPDL